MVRYNAVASLKETKIHITFKCELTRRNSYLNFKIQICSQGYCLVLKHIFLDELGFYD